MRRNLKLFRVGMDMSQEEFSDKIGYSRATYSTIESGSRNGRQDFWKALQLAFNVSDADMWELMRNE